MPNGYGGFPAGTPGAQIEELRDQVRRLRECVEAADRVAEVWSEKVLEAGVGTGDVWERYYEARAKV